MRKLLFYSLLVAFATLFSCKNNEEKPDDGKLCLQCAGEAAVCVGDEDEDGNTVTKEFLEIAYALAVAFEQDCTLD